MARPSFLFKVGGTQSKTGDAIDIAARHFVRKPFEATERRPMAWQVLHGMGEAPATVARAVQLGWVVGSIKEQSGCLTDEGRLLARKGSEDDFKSYTAASLAPSADVSDIALRL